MVAKAGLEPSAEPPAWFEDRYETGVAVEGAVVGQLALQLGVDEATVESRGAAPVLFRDTALGCPGESEFVTGAEIRGWIAYYEVNGLLYRVHGLPSGEFRLCEVPDFDVIPELDR